MRAGDSVACTDFEDFFDSLLTIIPKDRIGLVSADSGFYRNDMPTKIEGELVDYIVVTNMNMAWFDGSLNSMPGFHRMTDIGHQVFNTRYMAGMHPEGCCSQGCP